MPPHKGNFIIPGVPRSGKGQFVRGLADRYRAAGLPVLFYTSKKAEYVEVKDLVDYATMDAEAFHAKLKEAAESGRFQNGIIAIMDEAVQFFNANKKEMVEIMNEFPAYGVETYVVVQRAKMVPPNIRNACENIVCFRQKPDDAAYLAEQYGNEFLESANLLPSYFIGRVGGFGDVTRGRSYDDSNGSFQRV